MDEDKAVFSQVMDHAPQHLFRKCVRRYGGNRYVKSFPCWSQFLCMAFAQLSYRASLRDIETSLRAHNGRLYHMGIRGNVSRNTLANANRRRDWRIHADFARELLAIARPLYAGDSTGPEPENTMCALDAPTIDLCLSVFPWALSRGIDPAAELHTLSDLRGNIPAFIHVSHTRMEDGNTLGPWTPEPGAFYLMDRGYLDFGRLNVIHTKEAFFVIQARSNTRYRRRCSRPVDKTTGVRCDQTIVLTDVASSRNYPRTLRRVKYRDADSGETLDILTNQFTAPATTVAELYRCRRQVERFFRWIRQHLRIQSFFGTSGNAVRTQVWIAVSVCALVSILKKRLGLSEDLCTIMQALGLALFDRIPIKSLLVQTNGPDEEPG